MSLTIHQICSSTQTWIQNKILIWEVNALWINPCMSAIFIQEISVNLMKKMEASKTKICKEKRKGNCNEFP